MVENIMTQNRIREVDIFKGICILLVVMGHSWAPFNIYIYMFHMPAFFVASGYTYSGHSSIVQFCSKKIRNMLVPFFIINIIFILIYGLFDAIGVLDKVTKNISFDFWHSIKMLFFQGNACEMGGASWFLLVSFGGSVLYMLFDKVGQLTNYNLTIILSSLTMAMGWLMIKGGYGRTYSIDLILFSVGFIAFGNFLKRFEVLQKGIDVKIMSVSASLCTWFFYSFYFHDTVPMNWPTRLFDNSLFIQIFSCIVSMYVCWNLTCIIANLTWIGTLFEDLGRKTFTILVYHFVVFKLIFLVLASFNLIEWTYVSELTPRYYQSGILWIVFPMINIVVCYLFSKLSEKNRVFNFLVNAK